jgi:hypothetical protein
MVRRVRSYLTGTLLTIDKTTPVFLTGMSVHFVRWPLKARPVGVMLNTSCYASSRALLGWELCEGKEFDRKKRWAGSMYGAGTRRSLKCCAVLLAVARYSTMHGHECRDSIFRVP